MYKIPEQIVIEEKDLKEIMERKLNKKIKAFKFNSKKKIIRVYVE